MKASEAAKLAKGKKYSFWVMQEILADIKEAADKGRLELEFRIGGPMSLAPDTRNEVKEALIKLGYHVHLNEVAFVVSWRGIS